MPRGENSAQHSLRPAVRARRDVAGFLDDPRHCRQHGLASPLGSLLALWWKPTTFMMSVALSLAVGFLAIYGFDLYVNHSRMAGEAAEQRASASAASTPRASAARREGHGARRRHQRGGD